MTGLISAVADQSILVTNNFLTDYKQSIAHIAIVDQYGVREVAPQRPHEMPGGF